MGKRKKSSRKPQATRRNVPLDSQFTCLFCHHEASVTVRLDRKEGIAQLVCRVCDQRYQSKVNHLTEAVDIYSAWVDAADAANNDAEAATATGSRPRPSRPRQATPVDSDEE